MSELVTLDTVNKTYATPAGPVVVLRGVDFTLKSGDFAAMTGPSGSGKTTLLNIVALLDTPTSGCVVFCGQNLSSAGASRIRKIRKERIAMIFQNFCLLPHRSAIDNVVFRCRYLSASPAPLYERAAALLDELGLAHVANQPARLLSGGEMQRVAVARAMMHQPDLICADEPTGNLDVDSAKIVMDHLQALSQNGVSILLATHNPSLLDYASVHYRCNNGTVERMP
jgi:ABC-type lipoprotein export system ATPase subunit